MGMIFFLKHTGKRGKLYEENMLVQVIFLHPPPEDAVIKNLGIRSDYSQAR